MSKWPHSVLLSECSRQYGFLSCWARRILARAIISGSWLKGTGSVRSPSGAALAGPHPANFLGRTVRTSRPEPPCKKKRFCNLANRRSSASASLRPATSQAVKPSDRLTANNAPANSALVPATTIGVGSRAEPSAPAQQAALSPSPQEPRSTFRGVTDSEIRFGISAALSGPTKELGQIYEPGHRGGVQRG